MGAFGVEGEDVGVGGEFALEFAACSAAFSFQAAFPGGVVDEGEGVEGEGGGVDGDDLVEHGSVLFRPVVCTHLQFFMTSLGTVQ